MKCPICKIDCSSPTDHFKFVHHLASEDIVNLLFGEIHKLNDRIDNLCELLEVGEK